MEQGCPNEDLIFTTNQLLGGRLTGFDDSESYDHDTLVRIEDAAVRAAIAGELVCQLCVNVVADLNTGRLYCGREAPTGVLESNRRLASL
jgi:hypothetical protein